LIFGVFIIALGTILLYYLVRPGKEPRSLGPERSFHSAAPARQDCLEKVSLDARHHGDRKDLVYQRVYIDRSRIRR
jgi:hypothetical protein